MVPLDDEIAWFQANKQDLLKQHEGKYVAVLNQQVVDVDSDFDAVYDRVRKKYGNGEVLVKEVEEQEPVFRRRGNKLVGD